MKDKYLEYYMDSRIYTNEDIQKAIEDTKKDFHGKKFEVSIFLNRFGIYEIIFEFKHKDSIIQKIILWIKQKQRKMLNASKPNKKEKEKERLKKYSGNRYGVYKTTKEYKPY